MLVIRFYDTKRQQFFQTLRFPNKEVQSKIRCASIIFALYPDIAGFMIYEIVGDDLLPYHPFNGQWRYEREKEGSKSKIGRLFHMSGD